MYKSTSETSFTVPPKGHLTTLRQKSVCVCALQAWKSDRVRKINKRPCRRLDIHWKQSRGGRVERGAVAVMF